MNTLTLSELADLHTFIMGSLNRLKDEDGNLPFDSDSERRYQQSFRASMIVLDRIMEGRYDQS